MLETESVLGHDAERLKRPARQLSKFMCQELLFDYIEGNLDVDRRKAVEQTLKAHPDLQVELGLIRAAEIYCDKLAMTRISAVQVENLKAVRKWSAKIGDRVRYRNWPDLLKWSSQALVLSSLVALVALITPWDSLKLNFVKNQKEVIAHQDQIAKIADLTKPPPPVAELEEPMFVGPPAPPAEKTAAQELVVPAAPVATTVPTPAPVAAKVPAPAKSDTSSAQNAKPMRGFIYRMLMDLPDVESVTPAVREKIMALGGDKAGQVELGWHKVNPSGSYFHFTLPEKGYDDFVKTLEGYGRVRIYKNAHERIMPAGQIRIILWIEERSGDSSQPDDATKEESEPNP